MTHGIVTDDWGDGTYSFKLGYAQWRELDEIFQLGPGYLFHHLSELSLNWKMTWLREIIRCGLVGGGTDPLKALRLVRLYVELDTGRFRQNYFLARAIILAALSEGAPSPGEAEAVTTAETGSDASISSPPTGTLQ